jgi:hypothetical protein
VAYRVGEDIAAILEKIKNPLVFYALSLIITESFLYLALTRVADDSLKFYLVLVMAGLFVAVIGIVGVLTFYTPEHLYEAIVDRIRPHVISVIDEKTANIDETLSANMSETLTRLEFSVG